MIEMCARERYVTANSSQCELPNLCGTKAYRREQSWTGIGDGVGEFAIVNNLARSLALSFDFDGRNGLSRRVKTENGKNMQCPQ